MTMKQQLWPSGPCLSRQALLRRYVKELRASDGWLMRSVVRKSVGSNPTGCTLFCYLSPNRPGMSEKPPFCCPRAQAPTPGARGVRDARKSVHNRRRAGYSSHSSVWRGCRLTARPGPAGGPQGPPFCVGGRGGARNAHEMHGWWQQHVERALGARKSMFPWFSESAAPGI
jgi:hypothetical protein